RTAYTARLVPPVAAASSPRVVVADKDITDAQIVVPPEREITIRVTMEGNTPIPSFGLSLNAPGNTVQVIVRPEADGTFKVKLPEDERRVTTTGLPLGFEIKSAMFGSTDIRRQPLKIGGSAAGEIQISLAVDPAGAWGRGRGAPHGPDH